MATTSTTSCRAAGPRHRQGTSVYTIVSRLPIEADGRPRYRIQEQDRERRARCDRGQISRLG
jgi:hypothetical protein